MIILRLFSFIKSLKVFQREGKKKLFKEEGEKNIRSRTRVLQMFFFANMMKHRKCH